MTDIHKKVALVSGVTRGIGKAIAQMLVQNGIRVIGTETSEACADSISAVCNYNHIT